MKLTKIQLDKIVKAAADDMELLIKSAGGVLAKVDEGDEAPGEKIPEGSSTEGPQDPPAEETPEETPGEDHPPGEETPGEDDSAPSDASASPDPAGGDPAADMQATPEALEAEYSQLTLDECKMHLLACKSALMKMMAGQSGSAGPGSPPGAPPPGNASAPPADASAPPPPPAPPGVEKGEIPSNETNGEVAQHLGKSESDLQVEILTKSLETSNAQVAKLTAQFATLSAGFTKILSGGTQPLRKSVKGISVVEKPGNTESGDDRLSQLASLPRTELIQRLRVVTASGPLEKKDADAVNAFVAGRATPDKVVHLL